MKTVIRLFLAASIVMFVACSEKQEQAHSNSAGHVDKPIYRPASDMKWNYMFPDAGESSSEISILHVDSATGATQLMIRCPANFHVPKHWHSANETHTIISGTMIMECDGERAVLGPGSFNYMPKKMEHEAWTSPDEGFLVFITVDGPWDVNWVNGEPKPEDFVGGAQP